MEAGQQTAATAAIVIIKALERGSGGHSRKATAGAASDGAVLLSREAAGSVERIEVPRQRRGDEDTEGLEDPLRRVGECRRCDRAIAGAASDSDRGIDGAAVRPINVAPQRLNSGRLVLSFAIALLLRPVNRRAEAGGDSGALFGHIIRDALNFRLFLARQQGLQ